MDRLQGVNRGLTIIEPFTRSPSVVDDLSQRADDRPGFEARKQGMSELIDGRYKLIERLGAGELCCDIAEQRSRLAEEI